MKNFRKMIMVGAVVAMIGATTATAFAASEYSTPAEAVAGLTGRTIEDVTAERYETGKTYGTIANDAGKLEEFQAEMLQIKKDQLQDRVEAGQMTKERADEIIAAIEENQLTCDGTGTLRAGQGAGAGFGRGNGNGQGLGQGQGLGRGMGGNGYCGGACQAQ
jgi:hypothetical protein